MSNANVIWGSLNADSNLRKSVKMAKNLVSDQNRKYVSRKCNIFAIIVASYYNRKWNTLHSDGVR